MNSLKPVLEKIFSIYGIPDNLISDNGPPFSSIEFRNYMIEKGVNHKRITPLWPQANGQVERFMTSLTKIAKIALLERKDWKIETYKFLASYRNSPHSTTKIPPANVMFNRKVRHLIPDIKPNIVPDEMNKILEENVESSKLNSKERYDKQLKKNKRFEINDRVIVKQQKRNKTTPNYEPTPFRITRIKGTMITAKSEANDRKITRNITFFKKIPNTAIFPNTPASDIESEIDFEQNTNPPAAQNDDDQQQPPNHKYPLRQRRPPEFWRYRYAADSR